MRSAWEGARVATRERRHERRHHEKDGHDYRADRAEAPERDHDAVQDRTGSGKNLPSHISSGRFVASGGRWIAGGNSIEVTETPCLTGRERSIGGLRARC